jgi:outer membrane protein TolC
LGAQLQRTLGDLRTSTAELAKAIGRPYEPDIAIQSIWKKIDVKEVQKKWMGLNPELLEVQRVVARRQQIDESITTLLGKHWPRIDAIGDLTWLGYSKSALFDGDAMSWGAGVTLSVPIFSGLSYFHERREYEAQLMQAKFEEDKVIQSIRLAQIQASENLKTAEGVIDSLRSTVDLANQALEEARRNYRVSTIDYLQLLQTENSVLDTSLLLDQGQYDLVVALISYVKAFGFSADQLVEVQS